MAQVVLKNVKKVYPGVPKPAVEQVSLEIQDKEFVVLVGPSGCGKSTTLRMIAGLEEITAGEIYIGDRLVNDVPPKDRDIAMVFQNYALYPHMTVYKNMAFGLMLRKFPKAEIDRRVREAAEILGITEYLDRKPKALSGGQRQRVAVGRAIVRKPQVFLFDEPLSNLDAKMRVQMRTEISKLHHRLQATMIYVTHDQVEAMTMGDRIVVMNDARIQQIAEPIDLYDNPANKFVAGFIGSPPMNFIDGELVERGGTLHFVEESGTIDFPVYDAHVEALRNHNNKRVTFGVRPEDFFDPSYQKADPHYRELKARIEVVEPMGSEVYLYLTTGRHPFIARVEAHVRAETNDEKALLMNAAKGHYFDIETEKTIV
ncbi:MAG TPA: sn-glycerol-3-phosphate ABC transporter ATP-binding protein UgpC [Candidatus Sumerlaeota bacterium]|nr:sn-glycerol-3-phosphate ABC transporter ATP-binding protein UgpC [Candidatus Sumerlaeota bacterium]HOR29636.1 sn-glycerol-3-phosphate ABC transporter ATP-binding protein UgpC [Candidatus Sumerlaeota bacterium]HPK03717.1 sn-glycerol-3-phosphate ABC transporter ATP-binding protein UgpC [Candidatus Sumerlaeota bacterium]